MTRRASRSFLLSSRMALAVFGVALALAGVMCGGTTGQEGLQLGSGLDGAAPGEAAGPDMDSGAFDVVIDYTTRTLPDVVAPPDTGAEGGYPWPSCPPFIPVDQNGNPVAQGTEDNEIPAIYSDAGDSGEAPAPDGSACATYGWLGSPAVNQCFTLDTSPSSFPLLPPCNWCSGVAAQGSGAGVPLYDLCLNLYICALGTGCGLATKSAPAGCLCGSASAPDCILDAGGPCAAEELAALQATSVTSQTLENYNDITPQDPGYCGSALNFVFQNAGSLNCFALLDAAVSQ